MNVSDNIKYKKIVLGIKTIVTDGRGHMTYMDAFDSVIYDIFGVEHFSRRLNDAYSNREIVDVIERVGSDILFEIFSNKRLRGIIKEMTDMDRRIHCLRKKLRKQGKKGKRDKYDLKEYNWLKKTLKESSKYMRNRFGIKSRRTAYKNRYKNISDVLKRDDDDYEFASVAFGDYGYDPFDDDNDYFDNNRKYYEDDYDDEYDDYESTSELQDFERMMNGRPTRRRQASNSRRRNSRYNFDDPFEDDNEDDETFVDDELEDKVDALYDQMMYLSEKIQFLFNKSNHDSARIRNLSDYAVKDMRFKEQHGFPFEPENERLTMPRQLNAKPKTDIEVLTDFVQKLSNEVIENKKNNKVIAEAMDRILEQNSNIVEAFNSIFEDDDEDETDEISYSVEGLFNKPKTVNTNAIDELVNHVPDPYEMDDEEDGVNVVNNEVDGTVGELIDKINNSNDKPATPVEVTTAPSETPGDK